MTHSSASLAALFPQLNPSQNAAVTHTNGPALVLAGAGSGKTRVLTARICHLLEQGIRPWNILAVTFTNKAAAEMRERLLKQIGADARNLWVGTFHSIALRILRIEATHIGYRPGFVVYDPGEALKVVRRALERLNIDSEILNPKTALHTISSLKNEGVNPAQAAEREEFRHGKMQCLAQTYAEYVRLMRSIDAMDFDDLLLNLTDLWRKHPEILARYHEKFRYLLVDEYQDTNGVQFELLRMLAAKEGNIFVVGDDDQSIYRFRGATIENILSFESHYPDAQVFKLEQNYRSTTNILECANAIIAHNTHRHQKTLYSELGEGEKVQLHVAPSAEKEAQFVAREVGNLRALGFAYDEIAILYRTNAQSRLFESYFGQAGIPYRVVGSFEFWKRKEVLDTLAYLSLIHNPSDLQAFERVVNTPARGVGKATQETIVQYAIQNTAPILEAATTVLPTLKGKSRTGLESFLRLIHSFNQGKDYLLSDLVREVIEHSGIIAEIIRKEDENTAATKQENLEELANAALYFEQAHEDGVTLEQFLSDIMLGMESRADKTGVNLLTIHAAKGLEFPAVFLTGLENTLFPSPMSLGNRFAMEEERRLMYVAITRCKEKLFLTRAQSRAIWGKTSYCGDSPFLLDLPPKLIHRRV
ncbi:ATP-dependent helicase [Chrysiogenes arsenatis]|uniref:ATP-dependent helicase n=1 Tax=Chrysiogenes arsenatis TaxID=309797 RepID=UPI0003FC5FC0|nr:UvrD-helicase domain-containing protein [Chrysiogenes arsenatis]